ncbi:DUF2000 domain-containing protein [Pseudonocardia sp. EV170527-09]|uniref:DUF2000 domain-containing protein n=1 Tax=Pseudonocardia sp. EV170527-09 TaxID=2603411 RepID=UPI001F02151C|nr:DUF2000 domain-containing protein [Pseudonocardia sp. EV170527-09]
MTETALLPASPARPATKIAVVLRDDLLGWQVANVTAFLAAGVAAGVPELIGEPYTDADGTAYLPTLGLPVLVRAGDATTLATCRARAVGRGLPVAVFTSAMFGTGNDHDNRAVVAAARAEELDLVGLALHGPRNAVDKILKGTTTHP